MLLLHARWLLPVAEPPIERGTVAVDGRHIAYVGPRAGAPRGVDHDLGDALLMPGLVDAHTHLELTAMRGLLDGVPLWRRHVAFARARAAVLTDAALLDAARLAIADGLRAGVTTFADSSASGVSLQAMVDAGVRGIMYQEVSGAAPEQRQPALVALRDAIERLRPLETELARLGVAPRSVYAVHEDLLIDACAYALAERLPIAIHLAESRAEVAFLREGAGEIADALRAAGVAVERRSYSPVHLLKELAVSDVARPLLVHCVALDETDVSFVAESGCPVVHCPTSDAALGHGIAPVVELLDAGVTVALGTESAVTGGRADVKEEARLAALLQRVRTGRPDAIGAARALEMATLGGARALGLDDRVGSLEVGKEADLAAFPLSSYAVPRGDPVAAAVFALAGTLASFVSVAGEVRVNRGELDGADPELTARVQRWADSLREWDEIERDGGTGNESASARRLAAAGTRRGGAPPPGI